MAARSSSAPCASKALACTSVLQQRGAQYGYAFVERWEKATLVHGFLMESKPGETVLAAHWHSERRSLLIKLTRKCVLAINR